MPTSLPPAGITGFLVPDVERDGGVRQEVGVGVEHQQAHSCAGIMVLQAGTVPGRMDSGQKA